ncbi:DUF459 domain-containing protein [Affinibrenneria salicis]|uniref:DUF459 domain-containing protein n=1 Tax=Affinibrenneria salicis TaxID=2590031 RepID=A0A5J5G987_9GAMM|nr:SGNH family hydrolase [Affinibrenneria salicis]KAA9002537.1 DUF459 domain-containing protein [Affinibrenneria salicis]KAA9003175.1 DUF459 domain-containing protein [Affinibrenneria salicis]
MPTSDAQSVAGRGAAAKVVYILVVTALALVWLNQRSLNLFWQQKYHQESAWAGLADYDVWATGDRLHQGVTAGLQAFSATLNGDEPLSDDSGEEASLAAGQPEITRPLAPQGVLASSSAPSGERFSSEWLLRSRAASASMARQSGAAHRPASLPADAVVINFTALKKPVVLAEGDKVLFAGDSMMQGIAPHMMKTLRERYGIKSINLSKQSTGLAYPSFFNWPETISKALRANADIRLLVVFLGPNDPWDMPAPGGGKYLKFGSDEWMQLYRQRINTILAEARQHDVQVIWIGPPNMRKKKLSDSMKYLNTLYLQEVGQAGQRYVAVNEIFKYQTDSYSDYAGDGNGRVKLRSGDGIHFSLAGQQAIAGDVLSLVEYNQVVSHQDETSQP